MLINKKIVRRTALNISRLYRNEKFTRVSKQFYDRANAQMYNWVKAEVQRLPSVGKTIY